MRRRARLINWLLAAIWLLLSATASYGFRPDSAHSRADEETLRGITEMSIETIIAGIRDIPESEYRTELTSRLRAAGIKILPTTSNPRNYPVLMLIVDATPIRSGSGNMQLLGVVATARLDFLQVIPTRIGSQTIYIRGITWYESNYITSPTLGIVSSLRECYTELIDKFVADYHKVNHRR